jgi:hypothetical protein
MRADALHRLRAVIANLSCCTRYNFFPFNSLFREIANRHFSRWWFLQLQVVAILICTRQLNTSLIDEIEAVKTFFSLGHDYFIVSSSAVALLITFPRSLIKRAE